jgi:phospholipid transport system substrate-binding protein
VRATLGLLLLVGASVTARAGETAESATAVASSFNEKLLASMRNADSLGYSGRYAQLRPAVLATFDIPFMAEKVLGRRWGELSEQDRELWREVFADLLTATYAGRFVGYRGQTFVTVGEEKAARDTLLVLTRLDDPSGDDVVINYRLRRTDAGWRVVDVYLKGTVSELALRRSEYSAVLERDGFPALLEAVRGKIAALERGEDR